MRRLLDLPKWFVRTVIGTLVLVGLLFVGLTRTEYGREALKNQLAGAFNDRFMGVLKVERLTGNIAQTLYAQNVTLTAPSGEDVLRIDSLVIRPSWLYALRGSFSVTEVRAYRPEVLVISGDSASTWQAVFARRTDRPINPNLFRLSAARIRIVDGQVDVEAPARSSAPFRSLRQTRYAQINLDGNVERRGDELLFDVSSLTTQLPAFNDAISVAGQVAYTADLLSVNALRLTTQRSTLSAQGRLALGDTAAVPIPEELQLRIDALDNDLLASMWDGWPLRGPLSGVLDLTHDDALTQVNDLRLQLGTSAMRARGVVRQQGDSLRVAFSFPEQAVSPAELPSFIPQLQDASVPPLDSLAWSGDITGRLPTGWTRADGFGLEGTLDARWLANQLTITTSVSAAPDAPLATRSTVQLAGLDLSSVMARAPASRLFGTMDVATRGSTLDSLNVTGSVQLRSSRLWDYALTTLHADITSSGPSLQSYVYATTDTSGTAEAELTVDWSRARPQASGSVAVAGLDWKFIAPDAPFSSAYNADLAFNLLGNTLDNLTGTAALAVDSSTVRGADTTVVLPPHRYDLTLALPEPDIPRVQLAGEALEATVSGDLPISTVLALGQHVGRLGNAYVREAASHRYDGTLDLDPSPPTAPAPQRPAPADGALDLRVSIGDAAYLTPFLAQQNLYMEDGAFDLRVTTANGALAADLSLTSTVLARNNVATENVSAEVSLSGPADAASLEAYTLRSQLTADTLALAATRLPSPSLRLDYADARLAFDMRTDSSQRIGPVVVAGELQALFDRTRISLTDVGLTSGAYTWANPAPLEADLYADAIVARRAQLLGTQPGTDARQAIYVRGTLSEAPQDTLFVNVDDVLLRSFSEVLPIRITLGGQINGDVALTGGLAQPRMVGQLSGYKLSLDEHIIGNLDFVSRLAPGASELAIDLDITPFDVDTSQALTLFRTDEPAINEASRLYIDGTYDLTRASNTLDLDIVLDGVDLFFFELIYPNVLQAASGLAIGRGTITGTPSAPVFDASVDVPEARFSLPRFGLDYTVSGTVGVQEDGFDLTGITATDPTGGSVVLDGMLLFNDYEFFSFDLDGTISELQFMNRTERGDLPFYGQIWASGTASLTGPVFSATLRSTNATTTDESEIFIPVDQVDEDRDLSFIIFTDSLGAAPDINQLTRRRNVLARRPVGERTFADGVNMDFNIFAPPGSSINLVFDPLLGDVLRGQGTGRLQLQRTDGLFSIFGQLDIESGDYLFTAGDVFARRFLIAPGGTITWDGSPIDALINIPASFTTRASTAGLPESFAPNQIPITVELLITDRVLSPAVDLSLSLDRSNSEYLGSYQALASFLNQPERATEYATSVLLTNTFLLTTNDVSTGSALTSSGSLTFNSVSQLVTSQLNRVLSEALPNVDVNFGVSQGDRLQNLDVTGGVALFLLDERLVIRGQGVVFQNDPAVEQPLEGEVEVEVRLTPSLSFEAYVRREGDVFADELTNTRGAGFTYQTRFSTWRTLMQRIRRWFGRDDRTADTDSAAPPVVDAEL
ncbi:MAG: translocation/assembly module TamB domain-containing protein [Bacteroidota bacterium]